MGIEVGIPVGWCEGVRVGVNETTTALCGILEGPAVGWKVGALGLAVGVKVGVVGWAVGLKVGVVEGVDDGFAVGTSEGRFVGMEEGLRVDGAALGL